jgi:hypothetical protein
MDIIDTTSRDPITGTIGRFVVTHYRRGEGIEGNSDPGVLDGGWSRKATGEGREALVAALQAAAKHNEDRTTSFFHVVSLYDDVIRVWWPVALAK